MVKRLACLIVLAIVSTLVGCSGASSTCDSDSDCPTDQRCVAAGGVFFSSGTCVAATGGAVADVGVDLADAMATDGEVTSPDAVTEPDFASHCDDGVQDERESDVDCGGPCGPCERGESCREPSDCGELSCIDGLCDVASSCRVLRELGEAEDGEYRIDPDGIDGPAPSVQVYCDMTSDRGAGYTMLRIESEELGEEPRRYRRACADVGMEIVVPRTRAHGLSILDYNDGEPPAVVGVYPREGVDDLRGLDAWTGRCQGDDCRFFLTDNLNNSSTCQGTFEPSGDGAERQPLVRVGLPAEGCPIGQFADGPVSNPGAVICSTNDAGPPVYRNCREILEEDSLQATRLYGTHGYYDIQPEGADERVSAYCDFTRDGGGYTFVKQRSLQALTTAGAEDGCEALGLRLFIPRTRDHLQAGFFVGFDANLPPSGAADYLRLLAVYPIQDGSGCAMRPMRSGQEGCGMRAADDGSFFVHDSAGFGEPDGSDSRAGESLIYTWDAGEASVQLGSITEPATPATTERFICTAGVELSP